MAFRDITFPLKGLQFSSIIIGLNIHASSYRAPNESDKIAIFSFTHILQGENMNDNALFLREYSLNLS
jgi:hypothetical protein